MTGKGPGRHGIVDFERYDAANRSFLNDFHTATSTPAFASAVAATSPNPRVLPATRATFPLRSNNFTEMVSLVPPEAR